MLHGYLGEGGPYGQALTGVRVQAPSARSGSGSGPGPGRCFPVFPKVDAASPRGLMAPPGLSALGAKGSACDRLRLTGGLRAFALGSYIVPLRWEGMAPFRAPFFMPPLAAKTEQPGFRPSENHTTALRASEMHPFWWLAPPPSPRRGDFILRYALALFCPCAHPA